jgi:RNA recognition motif. (a.k.a. RRM, RBD, or RNP domain)
MDSEKAVTIQASDAAPEKKSNQIFIRNLSFDVTSDDLMKIFEEHGPVKNVSVVMENNVSRGFGFVKLYVNLILYLFERQSFSSLSDNSIVFFLRFNFSFI